MPVVLAPSGGVAQSISGIHIILGAQQSRPDFTQVAGLVPLIDCDDTDCRDLPQAECFLLPAFGEVINGFPTLQPTYENDFNCWAIDYPGSAYQNAFIRWTLERADNQYYTGNAWNWNYIVDLNDNTYGIFYGQGSIPEHPYRSGVDVNWGAVINTFGPGIYRIKCTLEVITVKVVFVGGLPLTIPIDTILRCKASEPFNVRAWNCTMANGTIKIETWLKGVIGDINQDYNLFSWCGMEWYDAIRLKGFIGLPDGSYEESLLEYNDGYIEEIRNKNTQRYTLHTNYVPAWLHKRLQTFGLMADTILASDYNYLNPDWDIKRMGIRAAGGYKRTPRKGFDNAHLRLAREEKGEILIRRNVESVIKSLCCPTCP